MKKQELDKKLGYENLLIESSKVPEKYPDFEELQLLEADRIYFSYDNPVVLFVDVGAFNDVGLRRIADIQKKAWNYRKILLLFAQSDTEIRIYNCFEKPVYLPDNENLNNKLDSLEIARFDECSDAAVVNDLVTIFSRIGVDCGLLWSPNYEFHKQLSTKERLDKFLVNCLKSTACKLEQMGLKGNSEIIHALLMRSLFVLFLEDRGAAKKAGLYERVEKGAASYFDILKSAEATYRLFRELEKHFNGNIFPIIENEEKLVTSKHLDVIRKCFIDGDLSDQPKLIKDWRLFDFKIISIELLSEIYENFLGEFKKAKGQFYTPYTLVNLILDEKLPVRDQTTYNVRILDPACGSGIFLVEAYKRLIKRWKNANPGEKISPDQLREILTKNIYGIEIEPSAIKVAAFSLYLALVNELDPKTLWIEPNYQLPYLICDPTCQHVSSDKKGSNLYLQDAIGEADAASFPDINLVVGNPPFGTRNIAAPIQQYLNTHKLPSQQVLAFIRKAVEFAPEGDIALIFNTKSLTNTSKPYQQFRRWLFQKNDVEKIYNFSIFRNVQETYGGRLFDQTNVPISIVFFKAEAVSLSDTIEYWAPKTYVKSNLIDGIVVDQTDIKHIPREVCQTGDNKIWKVAMWGSVFDLNLINRLNKKFGSLKKFFKESDDHWVKGSGYNGDSDAKTKVVPNRLIHTRAIARYYTPEEAAYVNTEQYREINIPGFFNPPYICIKEGRSNKEITASLIDFDAACKRVWCINASVSDNMKKSFVLYINSLFYTYFINITSASWGIERERSMLVEVLDVPAIVRNLDEKYCRKLAALFDEIKEVVIEQQKDSSLEDFSLSGDSQNRYHLEKKMDRLKFQVDSCIYEVLGLSKKEQMYVRDWVQNNMDMFESGLGSHVYKPTLLDENKQYADLLCCELNSFLESGQPRIGATVYQVSANDPLNMVKLRFSKKACGVSERDDKDLKKSLQKIDRYLLQQKAGKGLYVRKQITYYKEDKIYIIKQNQKRFWTQTQALIDASDMIQDIMAMESV